MTTLNASTITRAQIEALRSEAAEAGDTLQVEWCDVALAYAEDGDDAGNGLFSPRTGAPIHRTDARAVCARAINDARANA
jgi:hypothetical protein